MDRRGSPIVPVGQSAKVPGRQFQVIQRPVRGCPHVTGQLDEPGWNSGKEGYLEAVKRDGQAVSDRLDVRLFSGPTPKERWSSLLRSQGKQFGRFCG